MEFIDKSKKAKEGTLIIDRLLGECWNDSSYLGANYNTLKKPEFRKDFLEIILSEQQNYCCYCMKLLDNDRKTTLEHIIPHHACLQEFDTYKSAVLRDNVVHVSQFDYNSRIIPPAKYPHDIAYHNLVASCDSNAHCNHKRSDKYIRPLMYDVDIRSKVEYNCEGIANSDEYDDELEKTGISTNSTLKLYRKLWYNLAIAGINPNDLSDDDIEGVIFGMVGDREFDKILNDFFGKPSKKSDLLRYRWFYDYYSKTK